MEYRVICAGSRGFEDKQLVFLVLDYLLAKKRYEGYVPVILNGKAKGADALGGLYAHERGLSQMEFPANWNRDGRAAGPIRNEQMGKVADAGVVFLVNGIMTPGSKHMYQYMLSNSKPVYLAYRVGDLVVLERGQLKLVFEIVKGGSGLCLQLRK